MILKPTHRSFKPLASAGTTALLAALLSACGGGPIDNRNLPVAPLAGNSGQGSALSQSQGQNPDGAKYLTYEEWKAEEARSEEARKRAEEEALKQSEAERRKEEEAQKKIIAEAALKLAEQYDNQELNTGKAPRFVVVGLDSDTLKYEWLDDDWGKLQDNARPGWNSEEVDKPLNSADTDPEATKRLKGKFVSLHGNNVNEYYRQNCPVRVGNDEGTADGKGTIRHVYECMAGIYVGRNSSGKMCYTFFDRDGKVSHVNDNVALYPFAAGTSSNPYPGYKFSDASPAAPAVTPEGVMNVPERTVDQEKIPGFVLPPTSPVFSRLDVGQNMFMILNMMRRYPNPIGVKQGDESPYRVQQAVFKFNSTAQTIDIYQKNTDADFGTSALDDTCYVSFRTGLASAESTEGSGAGTPGATDTP